MKISKIFHWLYAFLMFLPVFFVLGKGLYVTFNDNAKDSYSGLDQNSESIVNVSSITDFDYSKTYYLGNSILDTAQSSASSSANIYFDSVNVITNNTTTSSEVLSQFDRMYIYASSTNMFYNFFVGTTNYTLNNTQDFLLEVKIRSFNGSETAIEALNSNLSHSNTLYYIDYFTNQQLDNALDYAMSQLNDTYMFSWAKDSFLSTPIVYITSLFNMPTDSAYITALCYWLNVSIIWLTFDVIMYVPLLTHRWLDKGIKE